jgi:hypothetical protein
LESIIRKLKIQTLKALLALRQHQCASLAIEFETASLTFRQRAGLAHRWDDTLKESHILQLMVDLLRGTEERNKTRLLNVAKFKDPVA